MVTNTYVPHVGGVARSVETFTSEYRRMGHHVLVIAPTYPEARRSEPGTVRVPALQEFNGSDFSVRLPIPGFLHQALDDFEPEIVHSHHPFLMGDTALRMARQRELPLVFTHHTLYERYTHYVPFDSDTMKRLAVELSTAYANLCSHVTAPSDSIAELLRARGVTARLEVVPTGIDRAFFADGRGRSFRRRWNIAPDTFVIGYVGRLAEEKNLEFLCTAVAAVLNDLPDSVFLVVGKGPARDRMQELLADSGVLGQAVFAGDKTGGELADAYNAADVFAFASHTETQGVVLAEAMAAGLPCIALDASGVREVVRDMDNGRLLAEDADATTFAEAIRNLAADRQLRQKLAAGARATAAAFDKERCAKQMLDIYRTLLDEGAATGKSTDHDAWDQVRRGLETEWKLLATKISAISASVFPHAGNEDHDRTP